jgi:hypothetical protein
MTKRELAKAIIESVANANSGLEALESVEALLEPLKPKDREHFAKWGYPHQKSDPINCWKDSKP